MDSKNTTTIAATTQFFAFELLQLVSKQANEIK